MITRFATLSSRLWAAFAILFMVAACGGGGGGGSFYDPDNDNGSPGTSDPLVITTTGLPNAIDGITYTALVKAVGGKPSYSWSILNDGGTGFTIDNEGVLAGIAPTSGNYGLTIQVKDSAGKNATTSLILTVAGTDSPAPLAITTTSLPNAAAGIDYNVLLNANGGQGNYQWTLLNDGDSGLQLRPDGLLNGTGPATGQYAITVSVRDDTRSVSRTFILTSGSEDAEPLTITTTSLPTGLVNSNYAAVLNATGGGVPYLWTLASDGGSGLTLSPAGVLSGVPTIAGTFGLVFRVSDGASEAQSSLTLNISSKDEDCDDFFNCEVTITTESLPPADRVVYAAAMEAVSGTRPYTWSGGDTSSPGTGFTVDPISGSITGNSNNLLPGLYGYTVTVVDSANGSDTRSYVIEVPGGDEPPVRIQTENPLPNATKNLTYSVVMRAVGGGSDKVWDVLETIVDDGSGTPFLNGPSFNPPGSADAGVLFWSAADVTVGNYLVTIRVKGISPDDNDSSEDVVTFNLKAVPAPIRITTTNPLPNATVGMDYTTMINSSGGGPTNTWTVISTVPEAGGAPIANGPTFASPGNASTGLLGWAAGNVVAGRYRVTVKVTSINNGVTTTDQKTFDLQAN